MNSERQSQPGPVPTVTPKSQANGGWIGGVVYVLAVLVVRTLHLCLLGGPAIYMNLKPAIEAKQLLIGGISAGSVSMPPVPVFLLAGLASLTGLSTGAVLWAAVLGVHSLFAVGYWCLVRNLRLPPLAKYASLMFFACLPGLNSRPRKRALIPEFSGSQRKNSC